MVVITPNPIDPSTAYGLISVKSTGSVVFHYAVVKADGGAQAPTVCIDYQFTEDAEEELDSIVAELHQKWKLEDVLLVRREGCLRVGEIISLVAVSSPNSEDAFAACRHGIARMKKMTTVRKKEHHTER